MPSTPDMLTEPIPTVTPDEDTARRTLAALRLKLLRWEANLTANAARYVEMNCHESARSARAQLDIVRDVFETIGR